MRLTSISSVLKKVLPDDSERRPRNRKARRAHLQALRDHMVKVTDGRALNPDVDRSP